MVIIVKSKLLLILSMYLLAACGGGSSSSSTPEVSKPEEKVIQAFSVSNKPEHRYKNGYELFPTMVITVDFFNNFDIEKVNDLFFKIHMSADGSANYEGQEFAYIFEKSKAHYRWVYGNVGSGDYCCSDTTDTYYEVNNLSGHVQLKLFHYGMHTRTTWSALKEKTYFILNAESKMFNSKGNEEAISSDAFPEEDVFTTGGYEFSDMKDDYVGNNNFADIASIKVELNFEHFKKVVD